MKRMTISARAVTFCLAATAATACAKKSTDSTPATTDTPAGTVNAPAATPTTTPTTTPENPVVAGVSGGDGVNMGLSGQLGAAAGLALADAAPDSILAVPYQAGRYNFSKTAVVKGTIDADGKFDIKIPMSESTIADLEAAKNANGSYDQTKLAAACPDCVGHSAAEIDGFIAEEKAKPAQPKTWVVVSYKAAAGDRIAEAKTFKFLGLKSGEESLIGLPAAKAKGDLALGKIAVDGNDAVGALDASTDAFDLTADVLSNLAATGGALKNLANAYINTDPETGKGIRITPYFMFEGKTGDANGKYVEPSALKLNSYSTYIAPEGSYKLSDVCNPDEAARTKVEIIPPAEVTTAEGGSSKVYGPNDPMVNAGTSSGVVDDTSRPGRKKCMGTGDHGFYFAGNQDGPDNLEQIQLSGQFDVTKGIPDDYWQLKIAGTVAAAYNLNVTTPVDAEGHARIFVPLFSFDVDGNKQITAFKIKFAVWNATTGAYEDMTDLSAARQLITGMGLSLSAEGNTGHEGRLLFDKSKGTEQSDEDWAAVADDKGVMTFTGAVDASDGSPMPFTFGGGANDLSHVFLYYVAGGNSYNVDLR